MKKYWKTALILSMITIGYNLLEGLVSIYFGLEDETLALFGFGADSFAEVLSGTGVLHLVYRMMTRPSSGQDKFERTALKVTGFSFYLLTAGLLFTAIHHLITGHSPETTVAGIVISSLSILTMYFLMNWKIKTGKILQSDALIADAHCTRSCLQLSFLLLLSSTLYEIFRFGYIDTIGSLGIAYLAWKEGREAFEKAKGNSLACCTHCSSIGVEK